MNPMTQTVLLILAALAMFGFGWWGRRSAAGLAASNRSDEEARLRKQRSLTRGAIAYQIAAVMPLTIAIARIVNG